MNWEAWLGWLVLTGVVVTIIVMLDMTSRKHEARQREVKKSGIPEPVVSVSRRRRGDSEVPIIFWPLLIVYYVIIGLLRAPGFVLSLLRKRPPRLEGGDPAGWTQKEELTPDMVRLRAWMRRLSEPTFLFVAQEKAGFSKLGGVPDLPPGVQLPAGELGPAKFLLQLDLAALPVKPGPDWLPRIGRLYAFWDKGQEAVDVVYSTEAFEPPLPLPDAAATPTEKRIGFRRFKSAPSEEWLGQDIRKLDMGDVYDIGQMRNEAAGTDSPSFGGVSHRLGGFPDELQGQCMPISCERLFRGLPDPQYGEPGAGDPVSPDIEKASKDWGLLLQIDSDDEVKFSWGDGGRLYVFVRREDAQRGDFSRTVTISQSH